MDSSKPKEPALARKTHKKSRLGCLECKRRRVKCDETKPACKNCTRRSTPCHFPESDGSPGLRGRNSEVFRLSPTLEGAAASNSQPPSPSRSPAPGFRGSASLRTSSAQPGTTSHASESTQSSQYAFDLLDLELWNHYLSSVALTLTDHPEGLSLWRDRIPKIAHTTSYAAQLLLAFSALNLYRNGDPRSNALLQKSASLQSAAINGMMVALNEDRPGNAGALWVAAMMLCFCSFGRGPQPGQYLVYSEGAEPEWLGLLQGVKSILTHNPDAIASAIPNMPNEKDEFEPVEPDQVFPEVSQQLRDLQSSVDALSAEDPTSDKYTLPIQELKNCYGGIFVRRKDASETRQRSFMVFAWLYRLEEQYLAALQGRRPMALVVLMHYLPLMAQLHNTWYLDGWVDHIAAAVKAHLHPAYERWLEWPVRALEVSKKSRIDIFVSSHFGSEKES